MSKTSRLLEMIYLACNSRGHREWNYDDGQVEKTKNGEEKHFQSENLRIKFRL